MEINGINIYTTIGKKFQSDLYFNEKDRAARTSTAGFDKAEFSNHGKTISGLNDLVYAVPDTREFRVKEVISAIENGTYNVNADQIAEKIMGDNLLNEVPSA